MADSAWRIASWFRTLFSKNDAQALQTDLTREKDPQYPAAQNPNTNINYPY
jgi:hypothetical protein